VPEQCGKIKTGNVADNTGLASQFLRRAMRAFASERRRRSAARQSESLQQHLGANPPARAGQRFTGARARARRQHMSWLCFLGLHRRSLSSVAKRGEVESSLCERCARPLIKRNGHWVETEPLYLPKS
jgi:hypothetical protein